jgi:pantetheine-phosphate adenylyltransferase
MMPDLRIGLYPGTFDPITNGHLDIIGRAARLVDRLVVGVALVEAEIAPIRAKTGTEILVQAFDTLLISFAQQISAKMIIRGLRAVSDFDYEFQMAGMNYRLDSGTETVFLMASEHHQFISSRFVKDIAALGGDISSFVPKTTLDATLARLKK